MGKVTGDAGTGYLRLDDLEVVRVEVEWRPLKGRLPSGASGVSHIVDKYVDRLGAKAKKAGHTLHVERNVRFLEDGALPDKDIETFTWDADYRAINLAWQCKTCNRIGLVRVFSKLNEDVSDAARRLMRSLRDHAEEGKQVWAVYGLICNIPEDFRLEEQFLRSGHIRLSFKRRKKEELHVERIGPASLILKEAERLQGWFEPFFKKALKDYVCVYTDGDIRGHRGFRVEGSPRSLLWRILKPTLSRMRRSVYLKGCVWVCKESNRIFVVRAVSKDRNSTVAEAVAAEVVCHNNE
ncbi:MAG: hypothetical protein DRP97_00305 [Candidatus Latescibacterota bacterium]|nr:MAG: hypothetical protein B1H02_02130 [Candidatus Latescibacteria bacterium 4484_107]RKY72650.1 MAG: hypothetical protein DRP97_00305 [Candidatus Latescibacterota bacterium]